MAGTGGRPTIAFYLAVLAVIGGLVYFSGRQAGLWGEAPDNANKQSGGDQIIDPDKIGGGTGEAEQSSDDIVTTVKEYEYVPAAKLPPVKGTAGYQELEDNTVRFALNVWAGWAPIIHANEGFQPAKSGRLRMARNSRST